jgi:hypothetical protein
MTYGAYATKVRPDVLKGSPSGCRLSLAGLIPNISNNGNNWGYLNSLFNNIGMFGTA